MADPGIQPPYLDPSQYPAYLDLQRKQMLAQALMQGSQQMNQTPADWNSMRVVPKRSALSSILPILTGALAGKSQKDLMGAQNNYFQGLMGGNAPPQTGAPAPSVPPSAPPNAQQGTSPVAPLTAQMPPQAGLQPPAQQSNPNLLTGDPRTSQMLLTLMGPAEYGKALAGRYAPTDLEKQMRAANIDPNSPEGQTALRNAVSKATTNVENVRPGGTLFDVNKGQPIFNAPQNGQQIQYGPNGPQVSLLPGATGAAGSMEQAEQTGKTLGSVVQVPQAGGGTLPQLGSSYFGGTSSRTAPKVGAPSFAASKPPGQTAYWSGLPTYQTPSGAGAQSTESAKTSELIPQVRSEKYQKFASAAMDAGEQERNDIMALRSLGNATVGPESERVNNIKGVLNQMGLLPSKQADQLTSSIDLGKYLNNNALANARQKFGGGRLTNTDVTLSIEKLNPGTNMTDKAIYNLTVENMIRSAYAKQMTQDFTTADKTMHADPQAFEQWYSQAHPLNDYANQHGPQFAQQALQEWKGGTASAIAGPTSKQIGGKTYVQQNGKWFEQ